jgi:peptidoglycan hydrolase-like protein with peptidoglycan-binding domain
MSHRVIDVSGNNAHPINWAAVKASGIDAVMIKATEGTTYTNPDFSGDRAGAKAAGLLVAAYHFARFGDAGGEAGHFRAVAGADAKVLDAETSGNAAWMNSFLVALGEPVPEEMTYGSASTLPGGIRGLLWSAKWGGAAPTDGEVLWQYTDAAAIPGISGAVDESVWMGSEAQYATFFGGSPVSPPPPAPGSIAPAFPLPAGDWYGPETANPHNHSGFWTRDRPGIAEWQSRMAQRGWHLSTDGMFGPESWSMCRQFQAEKGLHVDGLVGPITWSATWTSPVT